MQVEEYNCRACEIRYGDIIDTEIRLNGKIVCSVGTLATTKELSMLNFCQDLVRVKRCIGVKSVPYKELQLGDIVVSDDSVLHKCSPRIEGGTVVTEEIRKRYKNRHGGMLRISVGIPKGIVRASTLNLDEKVKSRVLDGVKYIFSNNEPEKMISTANEVTDLLCDTILESDATSLALERLRVSDDYTFKHSVDVATMAAFLGNVVGMVPADVRALGLCGLLHDVGKTKIPNDLINKNGKLTASERNIINSHPQYGWDICSELDVPEEVKLGVYHHHEKYDGTGYPQGLSGKGISLFGRILAVCDVYDALVTPRSYKPGFSPLKAMSIMMDDNHQERSIHFDNYYLAALRSSIQFFEPGQLVQLTDGRSGKVVYNNVGWPFRPTIQVGGQVIDMARDMGMSNVYIVGVPKAEGGVYEIKESS